MTRADVAQRVERLVANEEVAGSMPAVRLTDLAATANAEHASAEKALRVGLSHAKAAGEALTAAKEAVEGSWPEWVAANLAFHLTTANWYLRIWQYRDELEGAGIEGYKAAMRFLREEGYVVRPEGKGEQVLALVEEGLPTREIVRRLGITRATVHEHKRPTSAANRRRAQVPTWIVRERRATGSGWDRAYSYFRRCLDQFKDLAPNSDPRWTEAYEHLHWLEDFIAEQMRRGS